MVFIEVKLLNGNTVSIRKDLILTVMKMEHVSKETIKQRPFLKDCVSCTLIQLSINPGEVYCIDSYESIMQKLNEA